MKNHLLDLGEFMAKRKAASSDNEELALRSLIEGLRPLHDRNEANPDDDYVFEDYINSVLDFVSQVMDTAKPILPRTSFGQREKMLLFFWNRSNVPASTRDIHAAGICTEQAVNGVMIRWEKSGLCSRSGERQGPGRGRPAHVWKLTMKGMAEAKKLAQENS